MENDWLEIPISTAAAAAAAAFKRWQAKQQHATAAAKAVSRPTSSRAK